MPWLSGRRLPDIVAIRKDGTIDVIEVKSPTDNAYALLNHMMQEMALVPEKFRGRITVVRREGLEKIVGAEKSNGKHLKVIKDHADINKAFIDGLSDLGDGSLGTGGYFLLLPKWTMAG